MPEVSIERYAPRFADEWNTFIAASKNGTFLLDRSYMDYHSDRFVDHSLMIRDGEKLSGVFVANERDGKIESHGGLTYGGLIVKSEVGLPDAMRMFRATLAYYHQLGFGELMYKRVPDYLHTFPSNEDEFILFTLGAKLVRRDTSSVIVNKQPLPYTHRRIESISEARAKNFNIVQSKDCTRFWNEVLVPGLRKRYDTDPVHTSDEMDLLMTRFPNNIRLYETGDSKIMAGTVVYIYPDCVHTQYLSSTPYGRQQGALDFLIDHLIHEYRGKKYFSLGASNNEGGPELNTGLLTWKEGFGARTFVHDFYQADTSKFEILDRYA